MSPAQDEFYEFVALYGTVPVAVRRTLSLAVMDDLEPRKHPGRFAGREKCADDSRGILIRIFADAAPGRRAMFVRGIGVGEGGDENDGARVTPPRHSIDECPDPGPGEQRDQTEETDHSISPSSGCRFEFFEADFRHLYRQRFATGGLRRREDRFGRRVESIYFETRLRQVHCVSSLTGAHIERRAPAVEDSPELDEKFVGTVTEVAVRMPVRGIELIVMSIHDRIVARRTWPVNTPDRLTPFFKAA